MTTEHSNILLTAIQAGGRLGLFERYLTVWVMLCILVGIALGRAFPEIAETLEGKV